MAEPKDYKKDDYIEWLKWQLEGVEVFYKGVNITEIIASTQEIKLFNTGGDWSTKIKLCICRDCMKNIRDEIDSEVKHG